MVTSAPPPADSEAPRPRTQATRRLFVTPKWWIEERYVRVGSIPAANVIVIERTAVPSGNADLAEVFGPAEEALRSVERQRFGLLIDVRLARGRNDAQFEADFQPYRQRIQRGFRRVALVVATSHGRLQVQRYAREDGISSTIFDDYAAALEWLENSPPARGP